jgi:isocitrate dehydrogenase kinase/phosphatase
MQDIIRQAAINIRDSFDRFHVEFKIMTHHAALRFEHRDWQAIQSDSMERLDHYKKYVTASVERTRELLRDKINDHATWAELKQEFSKLVANRYDGPIVETFFNSVLRKIFISEGINEEIEFIDFDRDVIFVNPDQPIYNSFFLGSDSIEIVVRRIIASYNFNFKFADFEADIAYITDRITKAVRKAFVKLSFDRVDMLRSVFYRNKGAYLVGRIIKGNKLIPVVIPIVHSERGVEVDNVLLTQDEISIVFSFTRSYFFVEAENPAELIHFLRPLMPQKAVSELYSSIGYNRHAKTVLYKEIYQHLEKTDEKFIVAPGIKGMVMSVFTLPTYNMVFKVIKNVFKPPKTVTRKQVVDTYRFVFMHDRVGRMADPQEFEYLKFDKSRFEDEVLSELLELCSEAVYVEGNTVIIRQLFTERRMIPLNIYLAEVDKEKAKKAAVDYGNAVKELAAANIFPGDLLMKNFGVTRHGRVVFYDYDELCFLTQCNFRSKPEPRSHEEEYSSETWFTVGEHDVFPEEFRAFMLPTGDLRDAFLKVHKDLFSVEFWKSMQDKHTTGQVIDFFPYQRRKARKEEGVLKLE